MVFNFNSNGHFFPSSITIEVRRLGGGFGGKISRANLLAGAAAVAARKLQRPVRITIDLETHMTLVGWRDPFFASYEVRNLRSVNSLIKVTKSSNF